MEDRTFREIILSREEASAILAAHFGLGANADTNWDYSGRIEITGVVAPITPPDNDWIVWSGGKCPVPLDTRVDVRLRDNCYGEDGKAEHFYWSHTGGSGDIVAYRVQP